jgi:hypothetical protein
VDLQSSADDFVKFSTLFDDLKTKAELSSPLITSATPRSDQISFNFTVSRSAESKTFIIIAVVNREWNPPSRFTCETGRKFSLLAGGKQNDPKVSIVNFDAAAHAFFISFDYKQEIVCIMRMTTSLDALFGDNWFEAGDGIG